jgi:hypothetical protein
MACKWTELLKKEQSSVICCSQLHLDVFLNECLYSTVLPHCHERLCLCIQSRKELLNGGSALNGAEWVEGSACPPSHPSFAHYFSLPYHLVFCDILFQPRSPREMCLTPRLGIKHERKTLSPDCVHHQTLRSGAVTFPKHFRGCKEYWQTWPLFTTTCKREMADFFGLQVIQVNDMMEVTLRKW